MNNLQQQSDISLLQDFSDYCGYAPRCEYFSNSVYAHKETTFRIGGQFKYFIEPDSQQQLAKTIEWLKINKQPVKFLGYGSNLLVDSEGVKFWVLRLGRAFCGRNELKTNLFKVQASSSLTTFARESARLGFSGLEFAAGIPASVGGAVRMNAGAHNSEISNVLSGVEGFTADGQFTEINVNQLNFHYRHCSLPADFLITAATFKLAAGTPEKILANLSKNLDYRKKTQPLSMPSAGSIFRNPSPELSAGALLDQLGLKGLRSGNAEISQLHANWIVNPAKNANSKDVLELISICQKQALEKRSLRLQPEVVVW